MNVNVNTMNEKEITEAELVYLTVDKLFPHPDNPRKELGDLSELAASIKEQGIMQNLTVVPRDADTYTVIIGHRRLAAAKKAGLAEVPCVIVELDMKEQISVMISENMQRSDLTVYEEAYGMQMMLDLGDTLEDVSKQTGLSKQTVRRRTKLLAYDRDKLKKSISRGATLMDFEKLDKIKDPELRTKVFETIGTANFENELKKALKKEKDEQNKADIFKVLDSFATLTNDDKNLKYVTSVCWGGHTKLKVPEDVDKVKYYYIDKGWSVQLYREKTEKDKEDEIEFNKERMERDRINSIINDINERMYGLRSDFIKSASVSSKENVENVMEFAYKSIIKNRQCFKEITNEKFCDVAGIELEDTNVLREVLEGKSEMKPQRALLIIAYANFFDSAYQSYIYYNGSFKENKMLDCIYDFLEKIGYEMSDEEKALRDGTHAIYVKDKDEAAIA